MGAASREVRRARFLVHIVKKTRFLYTFFAICKKIRESFTHMTDLNKRTEEISDLVSKLTPISDMAILLGVTEIELREALDDPTSPASYAYRDAKARVALQLRERDIEMASAGNTTAAENVNFYYRQMLQDE